MVTVEKVLEDGLTVSFLRFFNGAIDQFHIPVEAHQASGGWRSRFSPKQRLPARVIYVSATGSVVRLSLLNHLLDFRPPSPLPVLGATYDGCAVLRADRALGLLLRLPTEPIATLGYAHISRVQDGDAAPDDLAKAFPPGPATKLRAKVVGFRPVDGLATVTLRKSEVETSSVTWAELVPGATLRGTVASVEPFGVLVQLGPGVRGLVPLGHISDAARPSKKLMSRFSQGQHITVRVVNSSPDDHRVTLTLKQGLLTSKLAPLVSAADAAAGRRVHGWVTGVTEHGVFVEFYNGVKGLVPPGEAPAADGGDLSASYALGQVVRCTVLGNDPRRGVRLSLVKSPKAARSAVSRSAPSEDGGLGGLEPGDIFRDAAVTRVVPAEDGCGRLKECYVALRTPSGATVTGRMAAEHLSDHPHAAEVLAGVLKPGMVLPEVAVLELRPQARLVVVTRKAALLEAAHHHQLPCTHAELSPGQRLVGYIASVSHDACFVRFGGSLTGRAGLAALLDTFITDPSAAFSVGQTVRAIVGEVDAVQGRFAVTLKPSQTSSGDAANILSTYFGDLELAALLAQVPMDTVHVGATVVATAQETRPYGTACDITGAPNLVGLITAAHAPAPPPAPGEVLEAAVLDVQPVDGIVDLSSKPAVLRACEKQSRGGNALSVGTKVEVQVQLVRQDAAYLIATIGSGADHAVAFAPTLDYNLQRGAHRRTFRVGQVLSATVAKVPAGEGGRLLVHVPLTTGGARVRSEGAAAAVAVTAMTGRIGKVHSTHANVVLEKGRGRLHGTEVEDREPSHVGKSGGCPLLSLEAGQEVTVAAYAARRGAAPQSGGLRELSMRPSVLAAASAGRRVAPPLAWSAILVGEHYIGMVAEVHAAHAIIALSSTVKGRVSALQASSEPEHLAALPEHIVLGSLITATVTGIDSRRQQLDLSLLPQPDFAQLGLHRGHPQEGELVMARIKTVSGRGLQCTLANGMTASVALTDLHDSFVADATLHLAVGGYIRGRVKAHADGAPGDPTHICLSLRESDQGKHAGQGQAAVGPRTPSTALALSAGDTVHGYVRSATPQGSPGAGVFVSLSEGQHGRVQLRELAAHFVEDPVVAFPAARHVVACVVEVDGGHVELSLKAAQAGRKGWLTVGNLKEGQVLDGLIKRVERYGVFVSIANSSLTGLVHVSELADGFAGDPATRYQPGLSIRAVVNSVDRDKRQISLSMRPSILAAAAGERPAGQRASDSDDAGDRGAIRTGDHEAVPLNKETLEDVLAAAYDASDSESAQTTGDGRSARANGQGDAGEGAQTGDNLDDAESPDSDAEMVDAKAGKSGAAFGGGEEGNRGGKEQGELCDGVPVEWKGGETGADQHGWQDLESNGPYGVTSTGELNAPDTAAGSSRRSASAQRGAKRERAEAEAEVRRRELARLQATAPASVADFEQLVMASPGSSYVWIQYMAWLLSVAEVPGARAAAERALERIDVSEEQERFNVWLAYLNLEARYADEPQASAAALLGRALQHADAKRMYLAAIDAFERAGLHELVADAARAVRRKVPASCKVWLRCLRLDISQGQDPAPTLERALTALPPRKHVKLLLRAALLEFRSGSAARGRALFERVLAAQPKRTDVWGMYIDQEAKVGSVASVRNLFERAIHLSLPAKKMRFIFKRYVEYEADHGGGDRVDYVKQKALEFLRGPTNPELSLT